MQSWITVLSKPYQFLDSYQKCMEYLNNNRSLLIGGSFVQAEKIITSMKQCSYKWALCYKKHILDLEQHTTSIGESLNSSLKNHRNSPMAALSLASSAMTCIDHSDNFLKKRKLVNEQDNVKSRTIIFGDQNLNLLTRKAQGLIQELLKLKVSEHDDIRHDITL